MLQGDRNQMELPKPDPDKDQLGKKLEEETSSGMSFAS